MSFSNANCKVCSSPNRAEIERLRVMDNKNFKELAEIVKSKWNENITSVSISRHFKRHFIPIVEESVKSSRLISETATKKVEKTLELLSQLENNLSLLNKGVEAITAKGIDNKSMYVLKNLLSEARLTVESISKLRTEFDFAPMGSTMDTVRYLLDLLKELDLNPEQARRLESIILRERVDEGKDVKGS
jgi:hypothetical protein